jgi:hypothetical protein
MELILQEAGICSLELCHGKLGQVFSIKKETELAMVACACHPSNSRNHKIGGGSWSRLP